MSQLCEKCGYANNSGDIFCSGCGSRLASSTGGQVNPEKTEQPFVQPVTQSGRGDDEEMTVGKFMVDMFLYNLPLVGFILSVVWGFSKTESKTKRNFAKATFIWKCIGVGAVVLFYMILLSIAMVIRF